MGGDRGSSQLRFKYLGGAVAQLSVPMTAMVS